MDSSLIYWMLLFLLGLNFLVNNFFGFLNWSWFQKPIPREINDIYDKSEYEKSISYKSANFILGFISGTFNFIIIFIVIQQKLFGKIDDYISNLTTNSYLQTLYFFGIIMAVSSVINLPFSIYGTFVIERKYGFNKTTIGTFIFDIIKSSIVSVVIGGGLICLLMYLWSHFQESFWIYAWIAISTFLVLTTAFYTDILVPIFNKLSPLDEGPLKNEIISYCKKVDFPLQNIYVIDGSKRSTKANAYFSGLGKSKKIVLYDTLIKNHSDAELIAIIAHEVGHYKRNHTKKGLFLSLIQMAMICYLFGYISSLNELGDVLGGESNKFHFTLIVFSLLFSPISMLIGMGMNAFSRSNEYEADDYAKLTYDGPLLIQALKKLSKDSLSNLTPHPWYVFVNYSHPSLLSRIKNISKSKN